MHAANAHMCNFGCHISNQITCILSMKVHIVVCIFKFTEFDTIISHMRIYIKIVIYHAASIYHIYIYTPRLCLYSVLMLSILIIFRAQHFFRVQIWANADQDSYFYYILSTPNPTPESAFKKKKWGFQSAWRVKIGVIG